VSNPGDERGATAFARAVSVALHPLLVFAALAISAAWRLDPDALPRVVAGMAVAAALVWLFVWQRHRAGHWSTVDASRPRERPVLYGMVLATVLAFAAWIGVASPLAVGVVAVVAMLCVAALANRWIKLSLHMASLAFAGMAWLGWWPAAGIAALSLLPLLGWSRLRLARHQLAEVIGGTGLGLAAGMLPWLLSR